jgi:carboxyl-terminal processing protease
MAQRYGRPAVPGLPPMEDVSHMSRRNLAWVLGIAAVVTLALAATHIFSWAQERQQRRDQNYELVHLFVDVLDEVDQKYVTSLEPERKRKLVEDMINGGLDRLDPHSTFINAKDYKQFSKTSKGKFGGIGIQLGYDRTNGTQLAVITPMVGTPAYEAGVQAGDLIVKIDGKSTENMHLNEAVELIQGDAGQKVVLTVLHEGTKEPVDVEITRAVIEVQAVLGDQRKPENAHDWDYMLDRDNKIGYIRLNGFSETAATEMRAAVEDLERQGVRGLVIDLRNNPGGLLRAAVEISDLFLTEGRIVSTKGRNQREEVYDAREAGTLLQPEKDHPMAVLVNRYSASASEIVAAALQDHHRAVIVGERSYGKGSVQNILTMEGGTSALKLTTASYWRPSGKNIHRFPDSKETDEWGVKPNPGFEVKLSDEERLGYFFYRRDRDVVHGKGTAPVKPPTPAKEKDDKKEKKPFEDRVLQKAVDYLRGEIKKVGATRAAVEVGDA